MKPYSPLFIISCLIASCFCSQYTYANTSNLESDHELMAGSRGKSGGGVFINTDLPSFSTQLFGISLMSLTPFAIVLFSSYIKTSIVLSLMRNAIGVQQSPPNQVLNGLSIIVAIYVMYPTIIKMQEAIQPLNEPHNGITSPVSHAYIVDAANLAKEPLREFLLANSNQNNLLVFYQLAQESFPHAKIKEDAFIIVLPSFIMTQIKDAFIMGTLIYLPFFIVDVVVSNILLALGMMMMSPLAIALPIKLGVMVMTNGWTAVVTSIIKSFNYPNKATEI